MSKLNLDISNNNKFVANNDVPAVRLSKISSSLLFFLDKLSSVFLVSDTKINDLMRMTRRSRMVGFVVLMFFFGIFGTWGLLAPIDGAVISVGQVVVQSDKKVVQHLEGGIIDKVMVREGQYVNKNEPLIYLSDVSVKSNINILSEKLRLLRLSEARLIAEDRGDVDVIVPEDVINVIDDEKVRKMVDNQLSIFESRKVNLDGKIDVMNKRVEQIKNEIKGVDSQLLSTNQQMKIVFEDLNSKRQLLKSGYISRAQIAHVETEYAALVGKEGEYQALIARLNQKIGEAELEIIGMKNAFHGDVINELKEVRSVISELEEKIRALNDVLIRSIISAPQAGYVTGIKYTSVGAVIPAGANIMEIIDVDEDVIVEARIAPNNIEALLTAQSYVSNIITVGSDVGLRAKVRLTAFNSRKVGLLQGVVTYVSANTIFDVSTGTSYYLAHIVIHPSEINRLRSTIRLYPGMPVVSYIITESRTLFSYLLSPIISAFDNSFRER